MKFSQPKPTRNLKDHYFCLLNPGNHGSHQMYTNTYPCKICDDRVIYSSRWIHLVFNLDKQTVIATDNQKLQSRAGNSLVDNFFYLKGGKRLTNKKSHSFLPFLLILLTKRGESKNCPIIFYFAFFSLNRFLFSFFFFVFISFFRFFIEDKCLVLSQLDQ